jgi:hypothetical protein
MINQNALAARLRNIRAEKSPSKLAVRLLEPEELQQVAGGLTVNGYCQYVQAGNGSSGYSQSYSQHC